MPREYIVRLVMDRRHRTLLALRDGRVVGAICYRPFSSEGSHVHVLGAERTLQLIVLRRRRVLYSMLELSRVCAVKGRRSLRR